MSKHSFTLVPFPSPNAPTITIEGIIERNENQILIRYNLRGSSENLVMPARLGQPLRKDDLWRTTCFEYFLAVKGLPQYWEVNLSPSGDWNVYAMDAYRKIGMREETRVEQIQLSVGREADVVWLESTLDLSPFIERDQILEAGITAVIQTKNGNESYWALTHPGKQADFHVRESFLLKP